MRNIVTWWLTGLTSSCHCTVPKNIELIKSSIARVWKKIFILCDRWKPLTLRNIFVLLFASTRYFFSTSDDFYHAYHFKCLFNPIYLTCAFVITFCLSCVCSYVCWSVCPSSIAINNILCLTTWPNWPKHGRNVYSFKKVVQRTGLHRQSVHLSISNICSGLKCYA